MIFFTARLKTRERLARGAGLGGHVSGCGQDNPPVGGH
jgi:hypothetical protein